MATKIEPKVNETPPIQTPKVTPAAPGPVKTGIAAREATPPPASAFKSGAPGLPEKYASAPALRPGIFAKAPAHKIGLNRPSEILGPNKLTVGGLFERIEEHLENPSSPTAHDLALMNGAFNILRQ